ncbi:MAG: class I SAM-dependent methyltransferase, partial [Pseudomonadota bacterium]
MSRLDSMLRRLSAQRDGLNWAAARIKGRPGDVLDLGLGNGRTYDHLREILPERRIWVIDRVLKCHPSCVPPEQDFLEGEA